MPGAVQVLRRLAVEFLVVVDQDDTRCRLFMSRYALESRKPTGRPSSTAFYRAMREALNVPEDDRFMTISEHDASNFRHGDAYGVARSADVVYIQITVFNTPTAEQKAALFRRIADLLGESPDIRPEEVFVTVLDAAKEN